MSGVARPNTWPTPSPKATGSWSPAGSASAAGKPPKARSGRSPRSKPTRSGPASSSPPPRSNGPANAPSATAAKVASGRPNAAATSTTNPPSEQPSFRRPRPWPGAPTFRAVTAMAARYAILPSPGRQCRTNRLNSGACACRYGCVSQDGGAAIPQAEPEPLDLPITSRTLAFRLDPPRPILAAQERDRFHLDPSCTAWYQRLGCQSGCHRAAEPQPAVSPPAPRASDRDRMLTVGLPSGVL